MASTQRRGRRRRGAALAGTTTLVVSLALAGCGSSSHSSQPPGSASGGSGSSTQGVTATTIRVGVPYVDLAAVDKQFGLKINQGNFPDAYNALIDNLNAAGGIDGRKLVPYLVAVNPTGTAPNQTVCTQMAEDDHVFAVLGPLMPTCFQQHGIVSIGGLQAASFTPGEAPNFTLSPPASQFDPIELSVLAKQGVFNGKKVGIFAGEATDASELSIVQSDLKADHVTVAQTGIDTAPPTDQVATNQQAQVIAQRFQSSGVDEVVGVGTGSTVWPEALQANQSKYNPPWVATSAPDLEGYAQGSTVSATYLQNVLTTSPLPPEQDVWADPAIQSCVSAVQKAFPNDSIANPNNVPVSDSSKDTYLAPQEACEYLALFKMIATGAGKNLTTASFTNAGYALRNISLPGAGGAVSFASNQPYAFGPVYLISHNPAGQSAVVVEENNAAVLRESINPVNS